MSSYCNSEHADAFPQRRAQSWRTMARHSAGTIWKFWTRWQQRQELLEYVQSDYRAAADIGITSGEARGWSQRRSGAFEFRATAARRQR
jgi:hypothetical protein